MIFTLVSIAFFLGVAFHVMMKVSGYKKQFPMLGIGAIWGTFLKQEWDSLIVSAIVLGALLFAVYIIEWLQIQIPEWLNWGVFVISLVLGYQGQRIAYKYLNTATAVLEKKADAVVNDGK